MKKLKHSYSIVSDQFYEDRAKPENKLWHTAKLITKLRCKAASILSVVSANPLKSSIYQSELSDRHQTVYEIWKSVNTTYKRVHIINFEKQDEDKEEEEV